MNTLFAAGLFDQPWLVAVFIIVGVISNWLMKRRQEKEAGEQQEGKPPAPVKPPGEFNLEETLRRLMGEEPPAPTPAPPPIPRAARSELPPVLVRREEAPFQPARQAAPPLRPPPIAPAQSVAQAYVIAVDEQQKEAARRFEQLNEAGRHPATVVGRGRENHSRAGKRTASPWRDPRSARQAFVASLVFAPPKGLEP